MSDNERRDSVLFRRSPMDHSVPIAVTDPRGAVIISNDAWKTRVGQSSSDESEVARFPLRSPDGTAEGILLVGVAGEYPNETTPAQVQSEKMAALSMLAGGIAHEFNNLMGGLLGYAQLAEKTGAVSDYRRAIQAVYQSATRARDVVGAMLGFVGRPMDRVDSVSLQDVVRPILTMVDAGLRNENIEIDATIEDGGAVSIDVGRTQQVLLNLVVHARRRLIKSGGGVVGVDAHLDGKTVVIRVADSSPTTTSESSDENGSASLALSTGRAMLRDIGGDIRETHDGVKLWYEMLCPVGNAPESAPPSETSRLDEPDEQGGRVLVVDDEGMVRDLLAHVLTMHGYETHTAPNGFAGVEKARHLSPELVIVDAQMPGMSGAETCQAIASDNLRCAFLMVTGAVGDELEKVSDAARSQGIETIGKPFEIEDVLGHVRRLIAGVRTSTREMS